MNNPKQGILQVYDETVTMTPDQVHALLYAEFPTTPQPVDQLAAEYHQRTEAYDRTVCTGPIGPGGGILPATPHEAGLVNRNAQAVFADLTQQAERLGIERADLWRTIGRYRGP